MQAPVSNRDRWLALGLLLGALLAAYVVLVHPWWTVPMQEADAQIEAAQARELRLRMQLKQAPQVRQRLEQARAQLSRTPGFLSERSAELATASLVQRLETVVAQASPGNRSCEISNRSPVQDSSREKYQKVAVTVRLRCGTPELASVLHALESGTPRLFVNNLNLLAQRNFLPTGEGSTQAGLDVSFDLAGYLEPTAAPAADADAPAARAASASTAHPAEVEHAL